MSDTQQGLDWDRAELALQTAANLVEKMYETGGLQTAPDENPLGALLASPMKDDMMQLMKLVTFRLVQKLMPMMGGGDPVDPELLGLRQATVEVEGDTATYKLRPGRLTTYWVAEKGQYKIDDYRFRVSWWWVLRNFGTLRRMRQRRVARQEAA